MNPPVSHGGPFRSVHLKFKAKETRMKPRLKTSLAAFSALALLSTTAAFAETQPGAGTTIIMAQPTWDTGWFHTEIYRQMLGELGYTTPDTMTLDNPAFYQAVAFGDVTLWVDGWFPMHNSYAPIFSSGAEVLGMVAQGGAMEGYLVDKATSERLNVKSLDDFKRPEVQEAFDRNGDGKADLVACPPGWNCEITIGHHLDAYELKDHVQPINANYAASMADAIAAYGAGEPIFFYTWVPNWTVDSLVPGEDVVWLEVPRVDLPGDQMELAESATREGIVGCVNDPCRVGFPVSDIVPVVNSAFIAENPAVRSLLETAAIPMPDIIAQNAAMNGGDTDIAGQATAWIAANRALVDGWLETARAAAK